MTSALSQGNAAAREGKSDLARVLYAAALLATPALADVIFGNLRQLSRGRDTLDHDPRVAVVGYELGHNAAGRAAVLAELHTRLGAESSLVGAVMSPYVELWPPLKSLSLATRTFQSSSADEFLRQMIPLVASMPASVVHLSKARGPNILTGALYKLFWNATVMIDIDDEELGFVGAAAPLRWSEWGALPREARALSGLLGRDWTRLAVGLVPCFDGVTVANAALQARYGGTVVRHARDETWLVPSVDRRHAARERVGVPQEAKVVLFFGTPRSHKGLLEVAHVLAALPGSAWRFVVVGDFEDLALRAELEHLRPGLVQCLPGQPLSATPEVLALADVCVLLQQGRGQAARLQTPAKLTDALAMGVPVLATATEGLQEFIDAGAVRATTPETLGADLLALVEGGGDALIARGREVFESQLCYASQSAVLGQAIEAARGRAVRLDDGVIVPRAQAPNWPPLALLKEVLVGGGR